MSNAIDFVRSAGWWLINSIYSLIDTILEILREINVYNIIDSVAENSIFSNLHGGVMAIAVTLLGLFSVWRFVIKIIDPDSDINTRQIVTEVVKCSALVLMSVFLFTQSNEISVKLSGYTGAIFESNDTKLSTEMLNMYIKQSDGYKDSDEYKQVNIKQKIKDNSFTEDEMYNEKYVTKKKIGKDEREYVYDINWLLLILVGMFFLYSLSFSGMMLARRQIEFLFLFLISPIVFATSIGNKQRRSAVIEQLVSLVLQGAVVMLIIALTVIIMQAINDTTFFENHSYKEMALKSILFFGCATFLITGSQVVNRFIGNNVSANSGREQLMSLMSFGHAVSGSAKLAGGLAQAGAGATVFGAGLATSGLGKMGGNNLINKAGGYIQNFGSSMRTSSTGFTSKTAGGFIESFGSKIKNSTPSNVGKNMRNIGRETIANSFQPNRRYRNRYSGRRI